jgi:uncharacterized protein YodC (DUF2158 family)
MMDRAGMPDAHWQKEIDLGGRLGSTTPEFFFEKPRALYVYLTGINLGSDSNREREQAARDCLRSQGVVIEIPIGHLRYRKKIARDFYEIATFVVDPDEARSIYEDDGWFDEKYGSHEKSVGWTSYTIRQLKVKLNWLADAAEFDGHEKLGLEPPMDICPINYGPESGRGGCGSYAFNDPLNHEACRNRYRLLTGGPQMWIGDEEPNGDLLLYWLEGDQLKTAVYPPNRVELMRRREPLPEFFFPRGPAARLIYEELREKLCD